MSLSIWPPGEYNEVNFSGEIQNLIFRKNITLLGKKNPYLNSFWLSSIDSNMHEIFVDACQAGESNWRYQNGP